MDGVRPSVDQSAGGPARILFTPAQAAELLQVRESWLRRCAARRLVPCTFLGKHLRFSRANLNQIAADAARPTGSTRRPGASIGARPRYLLPRHPHHDRGHAGRAAGPVGDVWDLELGRTLRKTKCVQDALLPKCSPNTTKAHRRRSPTGRLSCENRWCAILGLNQ
ncbi:helix-turn-helix domain-containing protein [Amycolatopsis pigmentata]|uniref:Helix-turn-helix domain-containing protein n=1 Tax=Amycolatopsis pigmentata TaxID=450801 RepID=A0ABW5FNG8_9PSEU